MQYNKEKEQLIQSYCNALNQRRAAIFAGAGLSVNAGFVRWDGLLKKVSEELDYPIGSGTDLTMLAQYYVNEKKSKADLFRQIKNYFPASADPTENHKILASLPIKTYWTTNYDHLIEQALYAEGKECDTKILPDSLSVSSDDSDAIIYKMHGDIDTSSECILTRDDFENYDKTHKAYLDNFSYDLRNKTFLFLGLSFNDPNIKYVLSYVRRLTKGNPQQHYYILHEITRKKDEGDETFNKRKRVQELFIEDLKNYGIQTCLIKEYSEITNILKQIKTRYQRNSVFLSGAASFYEPFTKEEVDVFISKLSASLIQERFRIVNGYGLGFGNEVLAGAIGELQKEHRSIDGNLIICPFPQGNEDRKRMWTKYRQDMISHSGISIFLFGNKKNGSNERVNSDGMQEEYEISKNQNNFLIPVGATGDMSQKLWENQKKIISSGELSSPSLEEMERLGDKSLTFDQLCTAIIDIVKRARNYK